MATQNSDLATNYLASPPTRLDPTLYGNEKRYVYASFTVGAELAIADTVEFCRLPKGARVTDLRFIAPDDLTSGIISLGWDAGINSLETADPNGFLEVADGDMGNAALDYVMGDDLVGWNRKFVDEVRILATVTEATNASTTLVWELVIEYVGGGS